MKLNRLFRTLLTALLIAATSWVLSGCGGGSGHGGGVGMGDGTGDGDGGTTPAVVPTLKKVYSSSSAPEQELALMTSSVLRISNAGDTEYSVGSHADDLSDPDDMPYVVTSIKRNAGGGYDFSGYDGSPDESWTVRFLPEHCDETPGNEVCRVSNDEDTVDFWTMLSPISGGGQLDLTTAWDYLSVGQLSVSNSGNPQRTLIVFGVSTPPASVPTQGRAVYDGGHFRADAYRDDDASNDFRQRYSGTVRIVANFDMSALEGTIHAVSGSEPGSSSRESWPTSRFTISGGRIENGQFTATLTGVDSDPNRPWEESVRGFLGQVVGRFFGPNAEELGGVVSAVRDGSGTENGLELYGYLGAAQLGGGQIGGEGIRSGVLRDYNEGTTTLTPGDGMARVERLDDGWRVTVEGQTVRMRDAEDYGSERGYPQTYVRAVAGGRGWFWSLGRGFGAGEFDHFDIKGWSFEQGWTAARPNSGEATDNYLYIVHGNRTPRAAVPTDGRASYAGRMEVREFPSDEAVFSSRALRIQGSAQLSADFAASRLTGRFHTLRSRVGNSGPYSSITGGMTFDAAIQGNRIAADNLSGTGVLSGYQDGQVRGAFFGPAAEEAGGVVNARHQTDNQLLIGYFGTDREE